MGIYIHFSAAPDRIRRSDWEAAFEDALQIAEKGQLCSIAERFYDGHAYQAGIPAGEDDFCRTTGLEVSGELRTGSMMEPHFIPRSFGVDEPTETKNESILAMHLDADAPSGISLPETVEILFNKTQGKAPHIWLLAMVCVFCDRFPDAASVMGDVTAGQVSRALQIAEDVLGRRLLPPLAYDPERLLGRVRSLAYGDELTAAKLFFQIYRGLRDKAFTAFIARSFSADVVYAVFRDAAGRDGIYDTLRDWLLLDKPLKDVARMLVTDPEGPQYAPEEFVKAVLASKLHIKEKEVYDAAFADDCSETPDDVGMLLIRAWVHMRGLRNRAIDRFIPLKQLKADCAAVFGDHCDVDQLFTEAAEALERDEKQKAVTEFCGKTQNAMKEATEYSMTALDDLFLWTPSDADNVPPALYEKLAAFLHMAYETTAGIWAEFRAASRDERIEMLIQCADNNFLLPDTVWIRLLDNVMEESVMRRYIALFGAPLEGRDATTIARLFLYNEALYDHIRETECSA